jgi:hypothetical protein
VVVVVVFLVVVVVFLVVLVVGGGICGGGGGGGGGYDVGGAALPHFEILEVLDAPLVHAQKTRHGRKVDLALLVQARGRVSKHLFYQPRHQRWRRRKRIPLQPSKAARRRFHRDAQLRVR